MNTFENFKQEIRLLRGREQSGCLDEFAQTIGAFDPKLSKHSLEGASRDLLEAHTRLALIDPLFESLGWRFGPSTLVRQPTAAIEVPVIPQESRRWMDYLGFETDGTTQKPKLMMEAKRYGLCLPVEEPHCPPERHPFREMIREFARGNSPDGITREWHGYIEDHLEYIRGLDMRDGRLAVSAITNGVWLVIIKNPHYLLSGNTAEKADILCFESLEKIEAYAETVYQKLSRHVLCRGVEILPIDDVPDVLDPVNIAGLSFASVITYNENSGPFKQSPSVIIAPSVALVGTNGSVTFCRTDSDDHFVAPLSEDDRAILQSEQSRLAQRLQVRLSGEWPQFSVAELVARDVSIKSEAMRIGQSAIEWRFLTGDQEWIMHESMARDCFAHDHHPTKDWHDRVLVGQQPSVNPRTMFRAGHPSQCRHLDLKDIRHRKPSGPSGESRLRQPSLCWLHELEQYACCQNCVFLTHCPATRDCDLPCANGGFGAA